MEALATLNNQRQFDFQNNGIEVMNFETLQRTYKENDIYGVIITGEGRGFVAGADIVQMQPYRSEQGRDCLV